MTTYTRTLAALGAAAIVAAPLATSPAPADAASTPSPVGVLSSSLAGILSSGRSNQLNGYLKQGWRFDEDTTTTMTQVRNAIGADTMARRGYTGAGVGVALLDTGVVPVPGLTSGNVTDGPDLSFESQDPDLAHLDTYGHGTHMAGIIAGHDTSGSNRFTGVAPDAQLTSLKLSSASGAVDVSQVIAGVDWVVQHRNDDPKNPIRVLNLSYGTDGVQPSQVDPLDHAVENAWRAGIVVVVSGGNGGGRLDNPATDPFVIAVGASDTRGTPQTVDDTVPDFSATGTSSRRVDLVAPGTSIASLRDPGSSLDAAYPAATAGDRLFRGSGTSQAAAVVSGAVALLLDQRPSLSPDQVKSLLVSTANRMPFAGADARGAGELDVADAAASLTPGRWATQTFAPSTGTGSLEASRGSNHVYDGEDALTGENDILGPFDSSSWAAASSARRAWVGGTWNGRVWAGSCDCDTTWSGPSWSTAPWTGRSWSGRSWSGRSWSGRSWSGRSWSGATWSGSDG